MKPMWADTDAETEAELIGLLRAASAAKRFQLADSLTSSVIALSRRALERRRPDATELDILLQWVGYHYGQELERELRDFVHRRGPDGS